MTDWHLFRARALWCTAAVLAVTLAAACGPKKNVIPANISQPDRYLLDKADEAIKKKRWSDAREYYRQVVDNYPQSPIRPDAKLGMGETYLGEGSSEALVMGANEFREFLTFYPTNAKADLAQFHLALCHQKQMRAAERDQTETKDALKEYQVFFDRYPNSPLMPEVRAKWREARDRLSQASYRVGVTYYRIRVYAGAIDRFREILRDDPEYGARDGVYYYLSDSLAQINRKAEAVPYLERLIAEFSKSEHLKKAQKRLAELKSK
ncbi:MAG TPA: outer membrane protein assembly factor BamD [Vicinamibacterales bacterium]|jgi:outer membrane protein assembly factor BamD|nr:outer membrane protein assembly factor BamD [Vicinamibacterales bacterium]